ncbi:hypothetical protein BDV36DRAFT_252709 [Aspergillus pseudocaelatus]|uniref:SMP domain-containing protein n=1 Tax=Aspergillus pseudocaelatus TaxID=1825620 RepID=A0ABQ6WPH8_9EURO|nr:hypothetical protein BDV36DRAFT_252709 [Aspergillus pseudocaelatus]
MTHKMSKEDASRIQSGQARGGHDMSSGGFASRAQAAANRNANVASQAQTQSKPSGAGYTQASQHGGFKSSQDKR